MTDYVKTELGPEGVADLKGRFERVDDRSDASEFTAFDAQFFLSQAFKHWHEFAWEIEPLNSGKFLVKAEGKVK